MKTLYSLLTENKVDALKIRQILLDAGFKEFTSKDNLNYHPSKEDNDYFEDDLSPIIFKTDKFDIILYNSGLSISINKGENNIQCDMKNLIY